MTKATDNRKPTLMGSPSNDSQRPAGSGISALGVYAIFTASGAAGLIYQVIWARWLSLVFGNTTVSVSIVLSSFMLGLALGSWLIGRRLHLIRDPMRLYAYLEFCIGIFAICFPLFSGAVEWLFSEMVNTDTTLIISLGIRSALAFSLLLLPTTLMGATLPLLTDFFRRDPKPGSSWKVGVLYAANTLGAALGTALAGFFLIELIGVLATTQLAAILNFAVALIGFKYSNRPISLPVSTTNVGDGLQRSGKIALMVLSAGGATALASEVLWTRALANIVGNSTYAFAMILVVYLVGIALGSWLMSLFVNRIKNAPLWLVTVQAAMGLWTLAAIFMIDLIRAHIFSDSFQPIHSITVPAYLWNCFKAMGILAPLALLSGASFALATRIMDPESEDARGVLIARAYAWNTIGAILGALAAGFAIAPFMDIFQSVYLLAVLYSLIGLLAYFGFNAGNSGNLQRLLKKPAELGFCTLLVVLIGTGVYQIGADSHFNKRFQIRFPKRQIVFHKPGLQGITTAIKMRSKTLAHQLLVNGMGMTYKVSDTKIMAHLPMLLHPDPENTLVICFGMGTTFRSAISHHVQVTAVELFKEVYEAFPYFFDDADRVRAYPRGNLVTNDGRIFLKLTRERYDVITIDPPPPIDAAGVNHLYSKDFLELALSRLNDGGILAHWIPLPGASAGVDDRYTLAMLLATFSEVYPFSYVLRGWNGLGVHVLGSNKPIEISRENIHRRLAVKSVAQDIAEWDNIPPDYFEKLSPLEPIDFSGSLVTDDRPLLEFNLLRYLKAGTKKSAPLMAW